MSQLGQQTFIISGTHLNSTPVQCLLLAGNKHIHSVFNRHNNVYVA